MFTAAGPARAVNPHYSNNKGYAMIVASSGGSSAGPTYAPLLMGSKLGHHPSSHAKHVAVEDKGINTDGLGVVEALEADLREVRDRLEQLQVDAAAKERAAAEATEQLVFLQQAFEEERAHRRRVEERAEAAEARALECESRQSRIEALEALTQQQRDRLAAASAHIDVLEERVQERSTELRKAEAQRATEHSLYVDKTRGLLDLVQQVNDSAQRNPLTDPGGCDVAERGQEMANLRSQMRRLQEMYETTCHKHREKADLERRVLEERHEEEMRLKDREMEEMRQRMASTVTACAVGANADSSRLEECFRLAHSQIDMLTRERDDLENSVDAIRRSARVVEQRLRNEADVLATQLAKSRAEVAELRRQVSEATFVSQLRSDAGLSLSGSPPIR
eukprot:PhM_4_TR2702/c0_g1_i1/m.34112